MSLARGLALLSWGLAAATMFTAAGGPASAQARTDIAIELFEPAPGPGSNLLNLTRSRTTPHLAPSVALFAHFSDDALQLGRRSDGDVVRQRLVDARVTTELLAAIGLFDRVEIGLGLPLVAWQDASGAKLSAGSGPALATTALGDLRASLKVTLLDADDAAGFGVAIGATLSAPTGDEDAYTSDGALRVEPRLVVDWRSPDGFAVVLNAGLQARPERRLFGYVSDDMLRWGGGVQIPLVGVETLALAGTASGTIVLGEGDGRGAASEVLAGLSWRPGGDAGAFIVGAGGGTGLSQGVGAPDARAYLFLGWTPTAPLALIDEDSRTDTDGDGIIDLDDQCPGAAEDVDGFEDGDGCPEPDNDGDGVLDASDRCPLDAEDVDLFEDEDGCPDADNDGDGVPDVRDGPPEAGGLGQCRDQRETVNGYQDEDGCPDDVPALGTECSAIAIGDQVEFARGEATVNEQGKALVGSVVEVLKSLGDDWVVLYVEGHAAEGEAGPAVLSVSRAIAVREALLAAGVPPERVRAVGFADDRPLTSNENEAGRAANRRVELRVIEAPCAEVE